MLAPTPLSLLCAIFLCLPLALIFTFTAAPSSTTSAAATTSTNSSKINLDQPTKLLTPTRTLVKRQFKNQTAAAAAPSPRIRQAEDEDGDDSLFKVATRVDPNPHPKPTKKLAFMFLTTSPLPFAPLWELFFSRAAKNLYNIYVHADPSGNYTTPFAGVFAGKVVSSKPTSRHTPTLIAAARRLLAHALLRDEANSMFALLSPSCIPIHSFSYTYKTLIKSRRSFIEILKNEPGGYDRWAARGEDAMLPEVGYEDFRIGSQFWVVKRKHARIIVRDRRVWSKFKLPCLRDDTCYPEEHYFPTLMNMVDPRGCIPCTLTSVDWRGGHGGHPRMYGGEEVGPELIRRLRKERPRYGGDGSWNSTARRRHDPFLFARKFEAGALDRLMMMADKVMLRD